jgi:hypothetical protein
MLISLVIRGGGGGVTGHEPGHLNWRCHSLPVAQWERADDVDRQFK